MDARPHTPPGEPPLLTGRVALVAGASGGIGRAVVAQLLAAGARVLAVDREGVAAPPGAESLPCDLGDRQAIEALFAGLPARTDALHLLVHCAGITADRVLWKLADEDWQRLMSVNLDSAFRLLRGATPWLREAGGGAVVLVTSINGERGKFGQSAYAASKAGMIGLGRTAARELGRFDIRVNLVAPGMIETAMTADLPAEVVQAARDETALGRLGRPEDVARAVLYLLSPWSAHVTGQVLRVDGGQLMA